MKPILGFASWLSAVHPLLKTGPKLWGRRSLSILWRLLCCWLDGGPHSGVKFNVHMMASIALWKCMMTSMSIKKTTLDFSDGLLVGQPHSGVGFNTWWQQCPLKMYTMTTMSVSNKPILDFSVGLDSLTGVVALTDIRYNTLMLTALKNPFVWCGTFFRAFYISHFKTCIS